MGKNEPDPSRGEIVERSERDEQAGEKRRINVVGRKEGRLAVQDVLGGVVIETEIAQARRGEHVEDILLHVPQRASRDKNDEEQAPRANEHTEIIVGAFTGAQKKRGEDRP